MNTYSQECENGPIAIRDYANIPPYLKGNPSNFHIEQLRGQTVSFGRSYSRGKIITKVVPFPCALW